MRDILALPEKSVTFHLRATNQTNPDNELCLSVAISESTPDENVVGSVEHLAIRPRKVIAVGSRGDVITKRKLSPTNSRDNG